MFSLAAIHWLSGTCCGVLLLLDPQLFAAYHVVLSAKMCVTARKGYPAMQQRTEMRHADSLAGAPGAISH